MEIKYFNSNFDKITQNKDTDQSITNVIEKLPSLNIISDKNLLEETIQISNQFKEKKEKIIVFGTGGSNLGARALNNIIFNTTDFAGNNGADTVFNVKYDITNPYASVEFGRDHARQDMEDTVTVIFSEKMKEKSKKGACKGQLRSGTLNKHL